MHNTKVGFTLEFAIVKTVIKCKSYITISFQMLKRWNRNTLQCNSIRDVNVIDAYSTDSELEQYGLKVLKDDKGLFPPYQGAPLLRKETLQNILNSKKY